MKDPETTKSEIAPDAQVIQAKVNRFVGLLANSLQSGATKMGSDSSETSETSENSEQSESSETTEAKEGGQESGGSENAGESAQLIRHLLAINPEVNEWGALTTAIDAIVRSDVVQGRLG